MLKRILPLLLLLCLAIPALAQPKPVLLKDWTFSTPEAFKDWKTSAGHLADVRVEDGVLKGTITDWDSQIISPVFDAIPANPWQYVECKFKTTATGKCQLYYTSSLNSPYSGFTGNLVSMFECNGDNDWHVYRIDPAWQQMGKLIRLRFDFPNMDPKKEGVKPFELAYIRLYEIPHDDAKPAPAGPLTWNFTRGFESWSASDSAIARHTPAGIQLQNGPIELAQTLLQADDNGIYMTICLSSAQDGYASARWTSSLKPNWSSVDFRIKGDGKPHYYSVNLGAASGWYDTIYRFQICPPKTAGNTFTVREITIAQDPVGPAEITLVRAGMADAINRAGSPMHFQLLLRNIGGSDSKPGRISRFDLPAGVTVSGANWQTIPSVTAFEDKFVDLYLTSARPVSGPFAITFEVPGQEPVSATGTVTFTPSLNLPKANYVPVPKPISTGKYYVGALYFPGWDNSANGGWPRIWKTAPERKPVLGWYDEANPEALDWHIKWLVENGIQYLMMDWYWNQGSQHLDHWCKGFQKCRYRSYIKWAVMWANHNPAGSHSEEDQRKVVKWWIDNYFHQPEYLKIDGKPVVMMWSVLGQERDMAGKGGVKRLNDISQEMARAAGYPGIHFSAMKFPEAENKPEKINWLREVGYESTSIYRYRHDAGRAEDPRRFSFQILADTSLDFWKARAAASDLPFFINITSGWDDRPWRNTCEIYGKTPELFRKICQDAKQFADDTGREKWLLLGPVNEWGEGSYIEPCQEYGFKMYEAVRDTFGIKPAGGWPLNYGPTDVGLGPYDLPVPELSKTLLFRDWTFDDPDHSWKHCNCASRQLKDGVLSFVTSTADPIISTPVHRLNPKDFTKVTVRIKVSPHPENKPDKAQLFWQTSTAPWCEPHSVSASFTADGQFHDLVFQLNQNHRWRGRVTDLRFDPVGRAGATVAIDRITIE